MLKNYLKIAFRNLWKNKSYSLINIMGLAIGMAACFFIFQYVRFELSYDRWHKHADRLYRVPISRARTFTEADASAHSYPAVGPAMKKDFQEVEEFARVAPVSAFTKTVLMSYTDEKGHTKRFNENDFYLADASFLTMFSFPFIEGDPATALAKPNSIVITETTARKYFGNGSPMGKVINLNNAPLKVTGMCKDVPENSHIKFDMLVSLCSIGPNPGYTDWGAPAWYNYILLKPGTDPRKIKEKLPVFTEKYLGAKMKEMNIHAQLGLQAVTDIHLKSAYNGEPEANGSEKTLYFLSVLGLFILVIAWINYINLSTAKSMERAREVGVRKVAGATRIQLSGQFILESLIINSIALTLSVVIVITGAPYFDHLIGKNINSAFLSSGLLREWKFWLIAFAVFVAGALQVGAYPAFILSGFKPALVLKGRFHRSGKGILFRKALVTFQFTLSILLIAGTLIVYRQLIYMRHEALGYNKDQMLVVKAPAISDSTFNVRTDYFKAELLKNPAITHVAPTTEIPGQPILASNVVRRAGQDKTHNRDTDLLEIDKDFIATYQIGLAAGANLTDQEAGNIFETKSGKALINEALVETLGFKNNEEALHQYISFRFWFGDIQCEIVGVVKNYHQRSLRESYEPILYYHNNRSHWGYFSINVGAKDLRQNLAYIENLFDKIFPGNAFESFFLDEYFDRQYKADERLGNIFALFTMLAIFIACLGLVGLSAYAIRLRTKEVGIRKVLGASPQGIVYLFFEDFIKLVCLAAFVAIPIVYFIAGKWLDNFAFHIRLSWFIFAVSPLLLMVISFITISLQSLKAALANPVQSLRTE